MAEQVADRAAPIGQAFVRITGTRRKTFVEFEYSINDDDLTVELIMPIEAFEDFCARECATVLPPDERVRSQVEKFFWREKKVGRLVDVD